MTTNGNHNQEHEPGAAPHVMPVWLLVAVWGALMVLTVATVSVTRIDLGGLNLWIAMAIAALKATLVALYFMHLRYERSFLGFIFIATLLFVFLFIGITLMDSQLDTPSLIDGYAPLINK